MLPESITNIRMHTEIRKLILTNSQIESIYHLGSVFKNVVSETIILNLIKYNNNYSKINIYRNSGKNTEHSIDQKEFLKSKYHIFNINVNMHDDKIIKKIEKMDSEFLKNNAKWALGIVTGNNKKYIKKVADGGESVYSGKDIKPYSLTIPNNFLNYNNIYIQQKAKEHLYRTSKKLIYRFISKELIFALDTNKHLTLNSANILIPSLSTHSIYTVLGFLNSKLLNFYHFKKFNTLKVLRGNLEQIPFILLNSADRIKIEEIVKAIIEHQAESAQLDTYLFDLFEIDQLEKDYISNQFKS